MNENLHPEMATESDANSSTAVGAFLRASRLRRGEDLAEVASQLRIRNVYLEAIEDGRFEELPGNTYAVGFIRTYAEYLGLDGERVVERYRDEITSDGGGQSLTFPTVVPENGIPRGAVVMVGLLVVAVGYGAWFFLNSADRFQVTAVAPVPEQIERAAGSAAAGPPASSPAASQVTLRAAEPSQPASAVAAPVEPSPPEPAPTAAETPAPAPVQTTEDKPKAPPQDRNALDKIAETIAAAPTPDAQPSGTPEATPVDTNPPADIQPKPVPVAATEPEQQPPSEAASPSNDAPEQAKVETPTVTAKPADVTPAPEPTPEPATTAAPAPDAPAVPEQLAALPGASDARQGLEQTPEPAASPEPAPTPAPEATPTPETEPTAATVPAPQIVIRAVIDSWIQVRDMEANQLVMTKLLRSGDTYEVPARRGLSLLTGNAGALEIEVDGKLVPSIGPVGTVRRNVTLDAEKLSAGTAITQ